MKSVANNTLNELLNKIPIIINEIDLKTCNNKVYNAVRILRKTLKRLESINRYG